MFSDDEMIFYYIEDDLISKILDLIDNIKKINNISKKGREKYFKIFNNLIISDSILSKTLGSTPKYNYAWEK